ncbi:MAG TPA: NAD(P)-dependent glycerol-3-phosphate dehydrogenase [Candidatus Limiplasma stercoravium]|nr:NAD(P)-dependent glycerol-3-phosphate dehydrogenase [Candidatus Limiplasma stercoravium]
MSAIAILGAGTWGTALAATLSRAGHDVVLWSALSHELTALARDRTHPHLPGATLPAQVRLEADLRDACAEQAFVFFAVPSVYVRSTALSARAHIRGGQVLVDVAKGLEPDTLLPMSGVIRDALGAAAASVPVVALSGPTHAEEVAVELPTTIVAACEDEAAAMRVQRLFDGTCIRAYTNTDALGVELCGAMKNVIALAAGISGSLGYGDNARAAIITRGMTEMTRLGLAMGCREQTFFGLAGIGDLIVTATSAHSRNNRAGWLIGRGCTPEEAVREVGMVVEGIHALSAVMALSKKYGVELPISQAVESIVHQGADPAAAVRQLMQRRLKPESV